MLNIEQSRQRYIGDGITTLFTVPWELVTPGTDLLVYLRDAAGVQTIQNYSFAWGTPTAWVPMLAGQQIEMFIAPPVGTVLAIVRNEAGLQTTDYVPNDPFPAGSHEAALDKLTMLHNAVKDTLARAMLVRETDGLAGGVFQAGGNRIAGLVDPVGDTDAATKAWVLAQISAPAGWAPDKNIAQWNADRIQTRAVGNLAPANNDVLTWSLVNNRWEPKASATSTNLLGAANNWTGTNAYAALATFNAGVTLGGGSLTFGTTQQRIKGRFYGTPYADRTIFQSAVAGQGSMLGVLPTLAAADAGIDFYGALDPDNAPILHIAANSTNMTVQTAKTGTGVTQPFTFYADGNLAMRIGTNGRMQFNTTTDNGAQINVNGTVSRQAGTFRAHRGGVAQAVGNAAFTKIVLTIEDYDQAGWYDAAAQKFIPQLAGKYAINFGVGMDAGDVIDTGRLASVLYKNGVAYRLGNNSHASTNTQPLESVGMATVDANGSTDYFEIYCFHTMGAGKNINGRATDCFIEGFHVG